MRSSKLGDGVGLKKDAALGLTDGFSQADFPSLIQLRVEVEPVPNRWLLHLPDTEQMLSQSFDSIKLFTYEAVGALIAFRRFLIRAVGGRNLSPFHELGADVHDGIMVGG
jgi:hypothetical protein